MATVVCIGKYPPLQGGISARTYWYANAMSRRGHSIHLVTECPDAEEIYSTGIKREIPNHPGIIVHRPSDLVPWHIPDDKHRTLSLLNKVLEVCNEIKPDLIEANYLLPYGFVAYFAGQITGLPYVLRHGGSDIQKFLKAGLWPTLWDKALASANLVVTDSDNHGTMQKWSNHTRVLVPYVPDPSVFHPALKSKGKLPVLALVGKANYYWKRKGWHRVIDIWEHLDDCEFLIVSQGIGLEDFKEYAASRLGNRLTWKVFVPPWEMPDLLSSIDCLFYFERDLPFPAYSNLAVEAAYCGAAVIVDTVDLVERYRSYGLDLGPQANRIFPLRVQNAAGAAKEITACLATQGPPCAQVDPVPYEEYVTANEEIIAAAIEA